LTNRLSSSATTEHGNRLGIGAAHAVGYGVDRDTLGFIITRYVDNS
jgi:hypothetical protein